MKFYETIVNGFIISTDKSKLDIYFIHKYLSEESYWAKYIPVETVKKSIDGSCCFGLYVQEQQHSSTTVQTQSLKQTLPAGRQVGFARVVTDFATFGYIADVFIIEKYRGNGLAKWLMETIMNYPELQELRRWMLVTKDAHALYAKFGFTAPDKPESIMALKPFSAYPKTHS